MDTAKDQEDIQSHHGGRVFTRQATGLVREVSPFWTFVFNLASAPTAVFLAVSIYWVLSAFPGGNVWIGLALTLVVAIILGAAYGLVSTAIPRVGGDYVLVGRVMHPLIGIISSFMWCAGVFASIAYVGLTFVKVGLSPGFSAIGLVSHSATLQNWGSTLQTNTTWQFVLGTAMILVACLLLATGWKITMRLMTLWWALSMLGILIAIIIFLVQGHSGLVANFNKYIGPVTGTPNAYQGVMHSATQAGVDVNPGFSLPNTWPTWGAIMSLGIWTWLSIYIAGEVRRARTKTQPLIMSGSSVFHVGVGFLMTAVLFGVIGTSFFTALNGVAGTHAFPFTPYYFFMASIASGSPVLAWIMMICFCCAMPIWIINNFAVTVRSLFAWAFDGLLPLSVSRVNPRFNMPIIATVVCVVLNLAALYWAVTSSSFFGVLAEAVLFNMFAMVLLAASAAILPYRRPDAWRASASTKRLLGIPVITILGTLATVACVVIFYLYLHYAGLGVNTGQFYVDSAIIIAAAIILYFGARDVRRRQGVDMALLTQEIPPE
jgi:APA family basic amino acid/polyamine antiporter